jgi:hypothetical protein
MEHHSPHESSTWGPHMHARRLHHRLWPSQSTSTVSSDHSTSEHPRAHAHLLPNHPNICLSKPSQLPRERDLVSMFEIVQRALVFKLINPSFRERSGTKPTIAYQPTIVAMDITDIIINRGYYEYIVSMILFDSE